ncbi:MAG: sulfite exporter TauE/SafE family protein, partial [Candidatus Bathyarchaeia archaeon]
KLLAATLLGALVMFMLQASLKKWRRSFNGVHLAPMHVGSRAFTYALGGATGFLMSLTSVGSGVFMLPFLILLFPIAVNRLVGTGIAVAAVISAVAAVGYLFMGALNFGLFLSFLVGSVPGVVLGSRLNYKTPARILKVGLVAVLLVASLALILG